MSRQIDRHAMAGTWWCPACRRALTDDESCQVSSRMERGRKVSTFLCEGEHVVRWIAPWEDVPK